MCVSSTGESEWRDCMHEGNLGRPPFQKRRPFARYPHTHASHRRSQGNTQFFKSLRSSERQAEVGDTQLTEKQGLAKPPAIFPLWAVFALWDSCSVQSGDGFCLCLSAGAITLAPPFGPRVGWCDSGYIWKWDDVTRRWWSLSRPSLRPLWLRRVKPRSNSIAMVGICGDTVLTPMDGGRWTSIAVFVHVWQTRDSVGARLASSGMFTDNYTERLPAEQQAGSCGKEAGIPERTVDGTH